MKKQFNTRASPASQFSINVKLSLYMLLVQDNYTRGNRLVYSLKASVVQENTTNVAFVKVHFDDFDFTSQHEQGVLSKDGVNTEKVTRSVIKSQIIRSRQRRSCEGPSRRHNIIEGPSICLKT